MRKFFITLAAAAVIVSLYSCQKTEQDQSKSICEIKAGLSAYDSKVSMTQGTEQLNLAWETGDKITVIGNTTEVFTIASGVGTKEATFTGTPVSGTDFSVIYPGTITSISDFLAFSYAGQEQTGNASSAHLKYMALATELPSYSSISFKDATQNGAIKFNLQLPAGADSASAVSLKAASSIFYTTNNTTDKTDEISLSLKNCKLSDNILTAYVSTSSQEVAISAGDNLTVSVASGKKVYSKVFTPGSVSFKGGVSNVIQLNNQNWTVKTLLEGEGTQASPYLLNDSDDLLAMKDVLVAGQKIYFKQMKDIDMTGVSWTPLNAADPYTNVIDFNGNGKKISNFVCKNVTFPSFFGVLNGSCYDLTFENADVASTQGSMAGIVAAYVGKGEGLEGLVDNVNVSGKLEANQALGGIAAQTTKGTVKNCSVNVAVKNTSSNDGHCTGGVVGSQSANDIIYNCTFSGSVTATSGSRYTGGIVGYYTSGKVSKCTVSGNVTAGDQNVGGILGFANQATEIDDCTVSGNVTATNVACVAGIVGNTGTATLKITNCKVDGSTITGKNSTGGIVGQSTAATTIKDCQVSGTVAVAAGAADVGGVIGFINKTSSFENCTVTGNVGTSNSTKIGGIIGETNTNNVTVTNCHFNGTLTANTSGNQDIGGIIGLAHSSSVGTAITSCSSSGTLKGYYNTGGIVGKGNLNIKINKCFSTMNITGNADLGGIIGFCIDGKSSEINDCYTSGSITSTSYPVGGIIGELGTYGTVKNCYSTASVTGAVVVGGIVGRTGVGKFLISTASKTSVKNCIAANSKVESTNHSTATNGSSGIVIGFACPKSELADCYRTQGINFTPKCSAAVVVDQPNATESSPLVTGTSADTTVQAACGDYEYPYHGKESNKTISEIAKSLGWDSNIWDFSGNTPTLK